MQASLAHLGFVDWCVVISAVCSVLLLIYAAADHLPKVKPMLDKAETKPRRYLPYILAAVAWFGVIIEIGDRHWWGGPEPTEIPLSEENARIDVSRWQPITNDKKQFLTNVYLANNGKSTALRWGFQGYAVAGALLEKDLVDAFFIVLRTKAKAAPLVDAEFQVGQSNIFISVPNIPPHSTRRGWIRR
ncbi:MAG TPA: hypothetical protein VMV19_02325 [Xanthobacteraceae bacterium]|nr:hypothetical protein [Xanthobacteraceae bacterium]